MKHLEVTNLDFSRKELYLLHYTFTKFWIKLYFNYSIVQLSFLKVSFHIPFDIFILFLRVLQPFLLTSSSEFSKFFGYLQRVLKIIFHVSEVFWNENFLQKWKKVGIFDILQMRFWWLL